MRAGGAALTFPESHVPAWLPQGRRPRNLSRIFLAVEDGAVRGAYILKHQPFCVRGAAMRRWPNIGCRYPKGKVDKQFASVGVQLYLDALRKQTQLYTVGIGGYQEAAAQMLISAGWKTWTVPFYFRVFRARGRSCATSSICAPRLLRRLVLDAMAVSGLGGWPSTATRPARCAAGARPLPESNASEDKVLAPGPTRSGKPRNPTIR